MDEFLQNEAKGTNVIGAHSLEEMVAKLKEPRRVILLVKAGQAVDDFITKLVCIQMKVRGDNCFQCNVLLELKAHRSAKEDFGLKWR